MSFTERQHARLLYLRSEQRWKFFTPSWLLLVRGCEPHQTYDLCCISFKVPASPALAVSRLSQDPRDWSCDPTPSSRVRSNPRSFRYCDSCFSFVTLSGAFAVASFNAFIVSSSSLLLTNFRFSPCAQTQCRSTLPDCVLDRAWNVLPRACFLSSASSPVSVSTHSRVLARP